MSQALVQEGVALPDTGAMPQLFQSGPSHVVFRFRARLKNLSAKRYHALSVLLSRRFPTVAHLAVNPAPDIEDSLLSELHIRVLTFVRFADEAEIRNFANLLIESMTLPTDEVVRKQVASVVHFSAENLQLGALYVGYFMK